MKAEAPEESCLAIGQILGIGEGHLPVLGEGGRPVLHHLQLTPLPGLFQGLPRVPDLTQGQHGNMGEEVRAVPELLEGSCLASDVIVLLAGKEFQARPRQQRRT